MIRFLQIAAALGVGSFLGAIFYAIVRQFGRKRGEGFETSKLGRQATAIIAVLIIFLGAAITIVGLIVYAPNRAVGTKRSVSTISNMVDKAKEHEDRAKALSDQKLFSEATDEYGKAIAIYSELIEQENRNELTDDLASCLVRRGVTFGVTDRLQRSYSDLDRAVEMYTNLVVEKDQKELSGDFANSLMNRGNCLKKLLRLAEALRDFDEAIKIYEFLVEKEDKKEHRGFLAHTFVNRSILYDERNETDKAIQDAESAIELYSRLVEQGGQQQFGPILLSVRQHLAEMKDKSTKKP